MMRPGQQDSAAGKSWNVSPAPSAMHERPTALDRLRQIQHDRKAMWREMLQNWHGWVFSLLFHGTVFLLLMVLIVAMPAAVRSTFVLEQGFEDLQKLTDEPLDQMFDDSPEPTEVDALPTESDTNDENVGFNELDPGAPDYMTMGGRMTGRGQGGGGIGDRLIGRRFRPYVDDLRKSGLDVVFVFDSTGSMGRIISETKVRIRQLMGVVSYVVKDARLGLVTYRDLREFDQAEFEYVTRPKALTQDVKGLQAWLDTVEPRGGGDNPEAVLDGLEAAMRLNWNTGAKKVIILFGDAPPRPENDGVKRVYQLCKQWHDRTGGIISCIDTSDVRVTGFKIMPEFKEIAAAGGGEATMLRNERYIIRQLVVYIFGSQWESEVDKVMKGVIDGPGDVPVIEK